MAALVLEVGGAQLCSGAQPCLQLQLQPQLATAEPPNAAAAEAGVGACSPGPHGGNRHFQQQLHELQLAAAAGAGAGSRAAGSSSGAADGVAAGAEDDAWVEGLDREAVTAPAALPARARRIHPFHAAPAAARTAQTSLPQQQPQAVLM